MVSGHGSQVARPGKRADIEGAASYYPGTNLKVRRGGELKTGATSQPKAFRKGPSHFAGRPSAVFKLTIKQGLPSH